MAKNKNAESLGAVHTHTHTHIHTLRVFQAINEIKQIKQKGVNILSYFVLLFNRCENNLIDKILIDGGGLATSTNLYGRRKTYYLIRFLLSYFGAKEVQFRVPRDIN